MSKERNRKIESRPFELTDEIKMHVQLWMKDVQYKKLNKFIQEGLTALNDSLKIADSLKNAKILSADTTDKTQLEAKKFIVIFKNKYLELTDFEHEEIVKPATFIIIKKAVEKLLKQYSNSQEYLNWFYNFINEDRNKHLRPPNIALALSNNIITKFLFEMKSTLEIRRTDTIKSSSRLALVKIAVELLELTQNEDLADIVSKFSTNKISYPKTFKYLEDFAEQGGFTACAKKLKVISKK